MPKKKQLAEQEKLCWNCLVKGHIIKNCNSKVRCRKVTAINDIIPYYTKRQLLKLTKFSTRVSISFQLTLYFWK